MSGESAFVVKRLRSKPISYTITISHFVRAGEWVMSVDGVEMDPENMLRVAADLRKAAEWIEADYGAAPVDDNPVPPNPLSRNVTPEPQ